MRVSCIQTPTALDSVLCKVHSLINLSRIDFTSFALWFFFQLSDSRLASRAICERATHAWRKDGDARVPQASAIRGDYAARRLPSRGRWHPSPRYRRSCDWRRAAAYARTLHAARHSVRASRLAVFFVFFFAFNKQNRCLCFISRFAEFCRCSHDHIVPDCGSGSIAPQEVVVLLFLLMLVMCV
jgi:hypothetical protein